MYLVFIALSVNQKWSAETGITGFKLLYYYYIKYKLHRDKDNNHKNVRGRNFGTQKRN